MEEATSDYGEITEEEKKKKERVTWRQVPTLKQASPLRVSPERRLVLDYRRHEIACVWWLRRTRLGSARDLVVRLSACPHHAHGATIRFSLVHSGTEWPSRQLSGSLSSESCLKICYFIYLPTLRTAITGYLVTVSITRLDMLHVIVKNTSFLQRSTSFRCSDPLRTSLGSRMHRTSDSFDFIN